MQNHYWIVERLLNCRWVPQYALETRKSAREACLRFHGKTRIRKFIAA